MTLVIDKLRQKIVIMFRIDHTGKSLAIINRIITFKHRLINLPQSVDISQINVFIIYKVTVMNKLLK